MKFKLIFALLLLSLLAGCAIKTTTPQFAQLLSENITIEAADGSWKMEPNIPFYPSEVTNVNDGWSGANTFIENAIEYSSKRKSTSVIVKTSNGEQFYGKIIFAEVYNRANDSSALRMWSVAVPEQYLKIARSGNLATVYQPYGPGAGYYSWILWLSKYPL